MAALGKLLRSTGHVDYLGQIYGPGEVDQPPRPAEYALGTFVQLPLATSPEMALVGVIGDTLLLSPAFGALGPRLTPEVDLALFAPDYVNEKAVLVAILALGTLDANGQADQSLPALAALTDTEFEPLSAARLLAFHTAGRGLRLAYAARLLALDNPLALALLRLIIHQLRQLPLTADQLAVLAVLRTQLAWQQQVRPFGAE